MLNVTNDGDWPTGYRINPSAPPLDATWRDAFEGMPSAIVSDCLGRNAGGLGLKPYHGLRHLCGSALTVRVRPGDNLLLLKAIQMARPGDVLVVDGSGDLSRAVIGGIMRAMALKAGIAGVVVNGAIRDREEWLGGELPVFALGYVHRGPSTDGGGEINVPVACAGMLVNPGDLIVGDADGVVAVRSVELPSVYARCTELLDREANILKSIAAGTLDPARFDEQLRGKGCPI
ncbi:RraA family protein [Pseudomonas asiatica]|uniref:RraA family protein n=1 Tax=Pseudomonas asiatica TaxID=2219225 RepID=UPI0025707FE0|nr:RraA family protein [Pseudomonas asiatica]WJD69241.1 RraA family protein [Pseudomonas asiatica]